MFAFIGVLPVDDTSQEGYESEASQRMDECVAGELGVYCPGEPITEAARAVGYSNYDYTVLPFLAQADEDFQRGSKEWMERMTEVGCNQCGNLSAALFPEGRPSSYIFCSRCLRRWFCSEACLRVMHSTNGCDLHEGYSRIEGGPWRYQTSVEAPETFSDDDSVEETKRERPAVVEPASETDDEESYCSEGMMPLDERPFRARNMLEDFSRYAYNLPLAETLAEADDKCNLRRQSYHCSDNFNIGKCIICNLFLMQKRDVRTGDNFSEHVRCLHSRCCGALYCSNECRDLDANDHDEDYKSHMMFVNGSTKGFGRILRSRNVTSPASYRLTRTRAVEIAQDGGRRLGRASGITYPWSMRAALYRVELSPEASEEIQLDIRNLEDGKAQTDGGLTALGGGRLIHHLSDVDVDP